MQGFVTGSLEPITLRDGETDDGLVVVVAVPEETDQAVGYGPTTGALPKTSSPQGDQGWIWEVHYVHVYNDHEPDWAEPPEFYVKAKANNGEWQSTSITPPVNNTSPWYFTKTIYDFGDLRATYSQLEIWEDDGWGTGGDDLVESYWYYSGDPGSCSKRVDTYSTYERQCIGCYGDRGADVTVQVREN